MKKILAVLLILAAILCFAVSCTHNETTGESQPSAPASQNQTPVPPESEPGIIVSGEGSPDVVSWD